MKVCESEDARKLKEATDKFIMELARISKLDKFVKWLSRMLIKIEKYISKK